jgi:hypothetical protein
MIDGRIGREEALGFVFANLKVANCSFTFAATECSMQWVNPSENSWNQLFPVIFGVRAPSRAGLPAISFRHLYRVWLVTTRLLHSLTTMGAAAKLRLYHEVTVATAEQQSFEYYNCHPKTGRLRAMSITKS